MLNELNGYYLSQEEPARECLLAMRRYILSHNEYMTETWTHRMPMFRYKGKLFCYLWVDKKTFLPYIGIYKGLQVEHPQLELGNRKKMKTMTLDPMADLPLAVIDDIFEQALQWYD